MKFLFKNKKLRLLSGVCLGTLIVIALSCTQEEKIDFNAEIRPILNTKCITCHGGVKKSGGFSLLFREEALDKGESGEYAIVPGKPNKSEMIKRLTHQDPEYRMPLDAPPLSEEEINKLTIWIKQGAEWQDHWAYVKPQSVELPEVRATTWPKNGIDRFILKKLEDEGLQPSQEADKTTLLRRVSLDLTGLPPTPAQVDSFLKDTSPDAYENAVDRLLASPHYGERWAAMWMDLARYADSKGYEKDSYRNIWRYRDYVIEAFNKDLPFDQFTIEQLAGDLLPEPTDQQLIATGFHRNTTNNDEGGTDDEEFRNSAVLDRVNTTWEVWQATTMGCVQCHSHPYDPFRHEEYYKFFSFFNNTRDEDTPDESPTLTFFKPEDENKVHLVKNWITNHTSESEKAIQTQKLMHFMRVMEPKLHGHNFDSLTNGALTGDSKSPGINHKGFARLKKQNLTGKKQVFIHYAAKAPGGKVEFRKGAVNGELLGIWQVESTGSNWSYTTKTFFIEPAEGEYDLYLVFDNPAAKDEVCIIEWLVFSEPFPGWNKPGFEQVRDSLLSLHNTDKADRMPIFLENRKDMQRKTHVFVRGNWLVKGLEVQSGVPGTMNPLPEGVSNNRLGMAQWLVSPDNPLTARVAVNRFWEQLFGTGIVETLEDFGSQGMKPSHPELLDWLALQLMHEHKWSIKKMLRQIVLSATYRQSSKVTPQLQEKDLFNRLLARGPRVRLSAEQVRDQALAVSGLLSRKIGGKSVMPPQPEGVWQVVYSGLKWETSPGEDAFRRGLYTFWRRSVPYPSMVSFDSPVREICVSRRIRTNTPLQALVTLNDTVYILAARGLALQMIKQGGDNLENQLKAGYKLATLREPNAAKLNILKDLYTKSEAYYQVKPDETFQITGNKKMPEKHLASLIVVANTILNLDEVITKE